MFSFSICFVSFVSLFLFSLLLFLLGFYFVLNDLIYFIEWEKERTAMNCAKGSHISS
jgi:hypothetical protein